MKREGCHLHIGFIKGEWGSEYAYAILEDEWRTKE
tara:strand:- start:362 stop:466 length:105 start_codon:yes stop_codon:yes gene_type:complete